ncbi:MAG: hypothetical protein JSW53_03665, partial [Candidatus Bathyarchaeota archaeon]
SEYETTGLFMLLKQEQNKKEEYKKRYEDEKRLREELEKQLKQVKDKHKSDMQKSYSKAIELGRKFGKVETNSELVISKQEPLELPQKRHLKKQTQKEHFQAVLMRHYVNRRWWDLLPSKSKSPTLPFRGPARQ